MAQDNVVSFRHLCIVKHSQPPDTMVLNPCDNLDSQMRVCVLKGCGAFDETAFRDRLTLACQRAIDDRTLVDYLGVLHHANGFRNFVFRYSTDLCVAAVDRCRTIPLFYRADALGCSVNPRPEDLLRDSDLLEAETSTQLLLSAYVSGKRTIVPAVRQIQGGEVAIFRRGRLPVTYQYFHHFPNSAIDAGAADLERELEDTLEAVFARYAGMLKERKLVLPLSGGYDSRLIGWMLWKHGVRNVLCYTYGVPGNPQVDIARRVAQALGFRWRFIEYTPARWAECMAMPEMREYWRYACRYTSCPHIQDFPAIAELHRLGELSDNPVFLPGHVGDAWACEFMVNRLNERTNHPPSEYHSPFRVIENPVVSDIIYRHHNLWPVPASAWRSPPFSTLAERLAEEVASYQNERDGGRWAYVEWVLRNRTANWIVNSCRLMEFFGGEYVLCLGDNAIIDFFRKLPAEHLLARRLYARTLSERVFARPDCLVSRIPVLSGGTRSRGWKPAAVHALELLHLYKPLDRLRRRSYRNRSIAADCWFTRGKASSEVTVGEALAPYGVMETLPEPLCDLIRPFLKKPAYSIQCNGLLAAVVLADIYSRAGEN